MRQCDWIVIPDKHPTIISNDIFEQVQQLLQYNRKGRKGRNQNSLHFSGSIFKCGCCGYGLRYSALANPPCYHCVHTLALPDAECHKMKVNAAGLENALLTIIKKQAEVVIGSDDLTGFRRQTDETLKLESCENRIKALSEQRQNCYERFMGGEIDRDLWQ